MLLTLMGKSRHEYSWLSPGLNEDLKVGFTNPKLAAEAMRDQIIVFDPAADGLGRDLKAFGNLSDGVEGRTGR